MVLLIWRLAMETKKVQLCDIKNSKGKTKKEFVNALTDLQINEATMSDPDTAILTDKELKKFKKVGKKDTPRSKK